MSELEIAVAELRALCDDRALAASWPHGAAAERIAAAEGRAGRPFAEEHRALLSLHDGPRFGHVRVLATADYIDATELYRRAREFMDLAATFGTIDLECVPIANLGQPNDWLLYDARRDDGRFVIWLNADDLPLASLAAALRQQARIAVSY